MSFPHHPPGTPGTLAWKANAVGLDPYSFARAAAGMHGQTGNQARFDLAMINHRRLRQMALAAAQNGQAASM